MFQCHTTYLCYSPVYCGECSHVWLFSVPLCASLENGLREFGCFRRLLSSTLFHISLYAKLCLKLPLNPSELNTAKWWAYSGKVYRNQWQVNFWSHPNHFFLSNAPHVLYGLRGLPSWAWQKCNRLLRLGHPWGAVTLSRWCEWWYRRM